MGCARVIVLGGGSTLIAVGVGLEWRARHRERRRCSASVRSRVLMRGQTSAQRLVHATVRSATSGLTCWRAQCIPLPFSRTSTTTLLALSVLPLPIGYPTL